MSDDREGRIEIELTSHAPITDRDVGDATVARSAELPSRSTPPSPDAVSIDGAADGPAGWFASERSRLTVTAGAVGVIALLLGWMLGRSGGDEVGAPPAATAAVTATTRPEPSPRFDEAEALPATDLDDELGDEPGEFDDELDEPLAAEPDTEPDTGPGTGPVATTTEAPVVTAPGETVRADGTIGFTIPLDERLGDATGTLFAVDRDRRILEIDLASGETTVRGLPLPFGVHWLVAADDWVAAISSAPGGGGLVIDHADGRRSEVPVTDPWSVAIDTDTETIWTGWTGEPDFRNEDTIYRELDLAGEATGRTIELPYGVWASAYDGGGFLVSLMGVVYRAGPEGHSAVGRGTIVAASSDVLVTANCDEELRCGLWLVDRSTGEGRWLPPGPEGAPPNMMSIDQWGGVGSGSAISPDGRRLAIIGFDDGPASVGVLDLGTGDLVPVDGARLVGPDFTWTWDPTSRLAYFVANGTPMVFDVASGESFPLSATSELSWSMVAAADRG